MVGHGLQAAPEPVTLQDAEAYGSGRFQVHGRGTSRWFVWWDNVLLQDSAGGQAYGTYSRTWKTKMYRVDGNYLRFSGTNDPAMQDPSSTSPIPAPASSTCASTIPRASIRFRWRFTTTRWRCSPA
jgi:hypothetical protein